MNVERVVDAAGCGWTVEQRFAPWRRILRPIRIVTGRYPRRALRPLPRQARPSRRARPRQPMTGGEKAVAVVAAPFLTYVGLTYLFVGFLGAVAAVVLLPLIVIEAIAQAIAGIALEVSRSTGLVRRRVDVTASTAHYLHSETVLLVHGRRRAARLVAELAAERYDAKRSFRPDGLPDGVEVRSHRSIWQSTEQWH